ncbi:MAG: SEC-C metal-binding domain-containing protein [Armatimonadota bacterium]
MEIKFTKEQYEALIKMLYLGNCVINGIHADRIKEFDEVENYIFSFAGNFGLENYVDFDRKYNRFFPSRQFEENAEIMKYEDDYNNETFWEELIDRLGDRDFIKKYGMEAIEKMGWEERFVKQQRCADKYAKEFETNGIKSLTIKKQETESASSKIENEDEIARAREKKYTKGFIASKYFIELPVNLQKTAKGDVEMFLNFLNNYENVNLENIRHCNVEFILTELFPRKVSAEPEKFRDFVPVLSAFFNYLKEDGIIKNADGIIKEIKKCEEAMVKNAANPEYYGMGKTMVMQMFKDNVDVNDQNAVERWIAEFNARPDKERDSLFDRFMPPSVNAQIAPKAGRNEPCPCGSGKKYKKCCGK